MIHRGLRAELLMMVKARCLGIGMGEQQAKTTGAQIRAARALLGLSAQELAVAAKLSRGTVQRAELESAEVTIVNIERIVATLETMGVVFLPSNGEGPGVRLKKRRK